MKKLLSMLAVSTLVGTSASNLKPVFTNNVVSNSFKSSQLYKAVSIANENNTNPFISALDTYNSVANAVCVMLNGTVWVGNTYGGLYKSTDGINFAEINDISATTIAVAHDGTIYVGGSAGLYAVNLLNRLLAKLW